MVSNTLNIGTALFTLGLLLGSTLPRSSWAMEVPEKEEGSKCISSVFSLKKSLNNVVPIFLKELGESAVKFHNEDTKRLDFYLAPSRPSYFLESYFVDVDEDKIEIYEVFFYPSLKRTWTMLNFSFQVEFPLSFVSSSNPLDLLISSYQKKKTKYNSYDFLAFSSQLNWITCPYKFELFPNEFEIKNNLYQTNTTFQKSCYSALRNATQTIDLNKLRAAWHDARFEIFKNVYTLDEKSSFNSLPVELKELIVFGTID
ncbi:MAG: hypothetical protein H0X26_01670 [Alphaproteobacteria bacterium]|nr:hypothetical protein [Alphaproteobacteria bacterium]